MTVPEVHFSNVPDDLCKTGQGKTEFILFFPAFYLLLTLLWMKKIPCSAESCRSTAKVEVSPAGGISVPCCMAHLALGRNVLTTYQIPSST